MSRAKIIFFPKLGTTDYPMEKIQLIEKYSGWSYNTDDYVADGYIYTDNKTSISDVNSNYWVKFKPVAGYKFQSVHKTNSAGTSNTGEFEIASDGSCIVYPWESGTATLVNNYLYFDVVESAGTSYNVTTTLQNCTSDNLDSYEENSEVTINLTCNDNYIFDVVPLLNMGGEMNVFTVSSDKRTATITFTITSNVEVVATATHTPYNLTTELSNCTCNYSDTVPQGTTTIIITADNGFVLNGVVRLTTQHITHTYNNFTQGDTVCSITLEINDDVEIVASAVKKVEQISTFTNLYKVDNDILSELSKVRFRDMSSNGSIVDYGSFITNLIKIPFEIPAEMIGDNGSIQLGNYDSTVKADILNNYVLSVNIGHITVPEKYKNIYDYKDTNCILHLPYSENMVIPIEYVINHTLTIEYKLDLYSGNCTVNVISDFTNEIVDSKTFNIAVQIPFMQEQNNTVVSTVKNIIDNGVKTAFVEVVRNIPYNVNSVFGNETVDFGILENYSGFIKVSEILLNISGTNEEKNEIENLLKNGVYINDIFY